MPNEFAQQMRVLHEIGGKPLNYVVFCYTQVLWYWKLLSPKRCKHFLSLTVSMSIMLESDEWTRNAYRQTFCYVLWWPDKTFPMYSVHGVIHLHEDASHLNCSLNGISCFLFENYLQQINKHVRSVRNPLEQVTRCLIPKYTRKCLILLKKGTVVFFWAKQLLFCSTEKCRRAFCL